MDDTSLFALNVGSDQLHITARINRESGPAVSAAEHIFTAAASVLIFSGMRILHERVFGTLDFYEAYARIREQFPDFAQRPFSYIQGAPPHGRGLSGIQIHAVKPLSDKNPRVLHDGDRPCGSVWEREGATYVHIAGLHGLQDGSRRRGEQAAAMFDSMQRILASQSADFRSVVRTWIYLDDIVEGYDLLNAVRTDKFKSFGLIPGPAEASNGNPAYLPASTGIGGRNPAGAFCSGDALAVSGRIQISVLPGRLQPSAYSYGSAFSRGVCIEEKEYRQIFVSGTAAIDAAGHSLYPRDAEAQISRTLDVVEALIGEKGAAFTDLRSATVYLKRAGDLRAYQKIARRRGLPDLPAVFVVADICRDELLFEMDALAAIGKKPYTAKMPAPSPLLKLQS